MQAHISQFGGDPLRVTIGGELAGAGAAILQAMAYSGREDHLFNNVSGILSYISRRSTKSDLIRSSHQAPTL